MKERKEEGKEEGRREESLLLHESKRGECG